MRTTAALCALLVVAVCQTARASGTETWDAYLDYAYVYSSADSDALQARLRQYGQEAGMSLERYITERFEAVARGTEPDEHERRREAIAYLLDYLARAEPESLERSVDAVRSLEARLSRHENRYWYHYILAHQALEKGRRFDFVGELLDLWRTVVLPLEAPYETLQTLSLNESPNSGFASALPYVYENVARIILLRSQELGVDRDLDPLGALVRMLGDERVGSHPDVIPIAASSKEYLDRIVERLDGPESDGGSLTFTLALFEAAKRHDEARSLLASQGLSEDAVKAIRVAAGAYERALDRADTVQGRCAVYTRVLRQIGEVYAAKQRLGVDPEVETPFSIEGAIDVYDEMAKALVYESDDDEEPRWVELGYAENERRAYLEAMHGLWQEIQEATLNAADYYLARSVESPHAADEYARNAARLFSRLLAFFQQHANAEGKEGVPESAYFAAHEAAKGVGDAFLAYALTPSAGEIELATRRYRGAMRLFPFERRLWSALTAALERQGRESEYMDLVRPAAEAVTRSRAVNTWIENGEVGAERIATLRRAFSDSLALMYLGFAEKEGVADLEQSLVDLRAQRGDVQQRLAALTQRRESWGEPRDPVQVASTTAPDVDAAPPPAAPSLDAAELADVNRQIAEQSALLERIDRQIEARTRTLPLYKATLETDGLSDELRARRDHPVHTLLRRMYFEMEDRS